MEHPFEPLPVNLDAVKRRGATGKSPTQRTLAYLRSLGYVCGIVERRLPHVKNRSADLFGIIDIIALTPGGVLGVQSTGTDFSGHWKKLTIEKAEASARWLMTPGTSLMLIGWRKVSVSKKKKEQWASRIQMIEPTDLEKGLLQHGRQDLIQC